MVFPILIPQHQQVQRIILIRRRGTEKTGRTCLWNDLEKIQPVNNWLRSTQQSMEIYNSLIRSTIPEQQQWLARIGIYQQRSLSCPKKYWLRSKIDWDLNLIKICTMNFGDEILQKERRPQSWPTAAKN